MKQRIKRWVSFACGICFCMGAAVPAYAWVTSTPEATGEQNSVYIAGNPSLYPVEYYDPNAQKYRGVIPELLEQVSEKTGIHFTYVEAGPEDRRAELVKNGQVDMVSCYGTGDFEAEFKRQQIIFQIPREDQPLDVAVAFTQVASDESLMEICSALEQFSPEDLLAATISYVAVFPEESPFRLFWPWGIGILAFFALLCLILVAVLFRVRKTGKRISRTDFETGIGNLRFFYDRCARLMKRQPWLVTCVAYLAFDIDRIRYYFGETEVQNIVKYAASVLTGKKEKGDIVARVSDSGFAILHAFSNRDEVDEWLSPLLEELNSYEVLQKSCCSQFKAGIYFVKLSDHAPDNALYSAVQGYEAAKKNHEKMMASDDKLLFQNKRRSQIIRHIEHAFQQNEFCVYLQFIVDAKTEQVCGGEVLSRWQHPEYGLLSPGQYMDILVETNGIVQLDLQVFECTCKLLADLKQEGLSDLSLSCNLSYVTLCSDTYLERMTEAASRYDFNHRLLTLEISGYSDQKEDVFYHNILESQHQGYHISFTLFGKDAISFRTLGQYPVDVVKLGKELFDTKPSKSFECFIKELIDFLHNIGKTVVCEGIENEQQKLLLQKTGCDFLQGYYFGHPAPLAEIGRILGDVW